ncbi:hypothetical protein [Meiothermus sp.]|uniref:hypothetical protein n=1 Tax=Meiothermus sp. TaxID=1955249 RepID=UPI00307E439A
MKHWHRWFALATLALMALGPGLLWSTGKAKTGDGFTQGWSAVPLPQQLVEAKSKLQTAGSGLIAVALRPVARNLQLAIHLQTLVLQAPIYRHRLYLIYSRLQTDGA